MENKIFEGQQFSRLTVLRKIKGTQWLCKCVCGRITKAYAHQLIHGKKRSCGCLQQECRKQNRRTHGASKSRLHVVWCGIKGRCYNPNHRSYKNYGGRGIVMCPEWRDNFEAFKEFMIGQGYDETLPIGYQTIERININGNYEPDNCKLAPIKEQNLNKRSNHIVTYKGITKPIIEFADELGIDVNNVYNRINNLGYSIEEALEVPVRKCPHKNAPKYKINDKEHTLTEWASILGMTRAQLKSKTRRKPVEEVVGEILKQQEIKF